MEYINRVINIKTKINIYLLLSFLLFISSFYIIFNNRYYYFYCKYNILPNNKNVEFQNVNRNLHIQIKETICSNIYRNYSKNILTNHSFNSLYYYFEILDWNFVKNLKSFSDNINNKFNSRRIMMIKISHFLFQIILTYFLFYIILLSVSYYIEKLLDLFLNVLFFSSIVYYGIVVFFSYDIGKEGYILTILNSLKDIFLYIIRLL